MPSRDVLVSVIFVPSFVIPSASSLHPVPSAATPCVAIPEGESLRRDVTSRDDAVRGVKVFVYWVQLQSMVGDGMGFVCPRSVRSPARNEGGSPTPMGARALVFATELSRQEDVAHPHGDTHGDAGDRGVEHGRLSRDLTKQPGRADVGDREESQGEADPQCDQNGASGQAWGASEAAPRFHEPQEDAEPPADGGEQQETDDAREAGDRERELVGAHDGLVHGSHSVRRSRAACHGWPREVS